MSKVLRKKRKLKTPSLHDDQSYQNPREDSFGENQNQMSNNDLNQTLNKKNHQRQKPNNPYSNEKQLKNIDKSSEHKVKNSDDITMGGQSVDQSMPRPYDFLKFANPPLHTIFVPHFTPKSINFVLSIIFIICFITLVIYSQTKPLPEQLKWNCSIFELQNKYYPRLRFDYQLWRVIVSAFFHSNIAHFILNLLGMQIYGYFVEWYYGKLKYVLTILFAVILSHFFSCIALPYTVSTMPSAILYSILALKIVFLIQYRAYKPLINRRIFIYLLLALIVGINLIPIFVNNNVDFTAHIGGFICGGLMGLFFHLQKQQEQLSIKMKILKFGSLALIFVITVIFIGLAFGLQDDGQLKALNNNISQKCTLQSRRVL